MGGIPPEIRSLMETCRASHKDGYSTARAVRTARGVLAAGGWAESMPVPVLEIAESFGFKVYTHSSIPGGTDGSVYAGGTTRKLYGTDRIILVRDSEGHARQRFITARELGHFLMGYLGSGWEDTPDKVFTTAYLKERQKAAVCADRFAEELLMPRGMFGARYLTAMESLLFDKKYAVPVLAENFGASPDSVRKRIAELSCGWDGAS